MHPVTYLLLALITEIDLDSHPGQDVLIAHTWAQPLFDPYGTMAPMVAKNSSHRMGLRCCSQPDCSAATASFQRGALTVGCSLACKSCASWGLIQHCPKPNQYLGLSSGLLCNLFDHFDNSILLHVRHI